MDILSLTPGAAKPVRSKDRVDFHCQMCGQCCRNLENAVMVESLDAYRIARYLREHGQPNMDMALFYEQYTSPMLLVEGYPIMRDRRKFCVNDKKGQYEKQRLSQEWK